MVRCIGLGYKPWHFLGVALDEALVEDIHKNLRQILKKKGIIYGFLNSQTINRLIPFIV